MTETPMAGLEALGRLLRIARADTGQARRVANFLLAWNNAEENGGWDPVDLWSLDDAIAGDTLAVLQLLREEHAYPENLGFDDDLKIIWSLRREKRA